jgi:hypothetical protein
VTENRSPDLVHRPIESPIEGSVEPAIEFAKKRSAVAVAHVSLSM